MGFAAVRLREVGEACGGGGSAVVGRLARLWRSRSVRFVALALGEEAVMQGNVAIFAIIIS